MRFRGVQRVGGQVVIDTPFLRDALLTCKAKGLLAVLYSWPQGEPVTITALLGYTCDGRDAVTKAWNELEEAGYLVTTKDGVQIAEKRQPPSVPVAGKHEKPLVTVTPVVPPSFVKGGKSASLLNGARIAENHETAIGAIPDKRQKRNLDALRKIANPPGSELPKIGNGIASSRRGSLLVENNTEGILSSDDERPANLFGPEVDEDKVTIFRNSAIGTWEVFKSTPSMREAEAKGIDVPHYFRAVLGWSNKLSPRVAKNQRTAHGWLSTAEDWMAKDLELGKLRTVAGKASDDAALMEFLNMGR